MTQNNEESFVRPIEEWTEVALGASGESRHDVYARDRNGWMNQLGRLSESGERIREALGEPYELTDCWLKLGWFLKVPWDVELFSSVGRTHSLFLVKVGDVWTVVPERNFGC